MPNAVWNATSCFNSIPYRSSVILPTDQTTQQRNLSMIRDKARDIAGRAHMEETSLTVPNLAEMVKEGPVIVTQNGQPLLAVKDVSGSDLESVSLASNPRFMAIIKDSRESYKKAGGIGLDELSRELE